MAFDHYISKSVTKPWRTPGKEVHRFDFVTDTFDKPRWKKVYGKDDLNSPRLETWLRDVIETPLGRARPRLESADPLALSDPEFFRAAVLMLMLQSSRTATAIEEPGSSAQQDAKRTLEDLATWALPELNDLVRQYAKPLSLRLMFTPIVRGGWAPLSVPSTGIFPLHFADHGCLSGGAIGSALPIHPRCALVTTPPGGEGDIDLETAAVSLARSSIGNSNSRYVVLHSRLVDSMPADELRRRLRLIRKMNDDAADAVEEHRSRIVLALTQVGLSVDEDPSGRLSAR